jgi:hypothetical protein
MVLTYMSIRDEIRRCLSADPPLLVQVRPFNDRLPVKRWLYATPNEARFIHGPWDSLEDEILGRRVQSVVERFIGGNLILITEDGYMKSLYPPEDEVWEIRCLEQPMVRLFGAFTEKDFFVILGWRFRDVLGLKGSREWAEAIRACKADWRKLFHTYPRHSGSDAGDYLSNAVILR